MVVLVIVYNKVFLTTFLFSFLIILVWKGGYDLVNQNLIQSSIFFIDSLYHQQLCVFTYFEKVANTCSPTYLYTKSNLPCTFPSLSKLT